MKSAEPTKSTENTESIDSEDSGESIMSYRSWCGTCNRRDVDSIKVGGIRVAVSSAKRIMTTVKDGETTEAEVDLYYSKAEKESLKNAPILDPTSLGSRLDTIKWSAFYDLIGEFDDAVGDNSQNRWIMYIKVDDGEYNIRCTAPLTTGDIDIKVQEWYYNMTNQVIRDDMRTRHGVYHLGLVRVEKGKISAVKWTAIYGKPV